MLTRLRLRLPRLVAVTVVAAVLPGCMGGGGSDGYRVTAYFDKAVSLYEQSDVKILGLSAGTVDEIEVEGTRVRVRMTIDADQPIPADVQATIVPLSLIGERYVQLFPAWTAGQPKAEPDTVIPVERTSIPTEPDEALAALKKFLDALDPHATGRLVHNLAQDLDGNGQGLNDALRSLADLTSNLAAKDSELVGIIDNFDRFTATLRTRERQLGQVMDQFASATRLLAEERENIAGLVNALSRLSADGLDLVSEHGGRLDKDLTQLTRLLQSVRANINTVAQLLDATPMLVAGPDLDGKDEGLAAAYDEKYHHIDLRNQVSPTLTGLFEALRLPTARTVCLPIDVDCPPGTTPGTPGFGAASTSRRPQSPVAAPLSGGAGEGAGVLGPLDTIPPLAPMEEPPSASSSSSGGPLDGFKRAVRTLVGAAS